MTIDDYRLEDILFSTTNLGCAFTVVAIDYERSIVELQPSHSRVGDKIIPLRSYYGTWWRPATAPDFYLFKRARKAAKVV